MRTCMMTESTVNTSTFIFKYHLQSTTVPQVDKLRDTTANSVFCLSLAFAGSETEEGAILPHKFHFLEQTTL